MLFPNIKLALPLVAALMMTGLQPCLSQDQEEQVPASTTAAAIPAEAGLDPTLDDPAFARYIDLVLLGRAWDNLDAALLADCALQLAEGERVLHRSHTAITSAQIFELAAKTAADKKDNKTLDRLAKACEASKNTAALEQINFARKLAGQTRGATPAASLSALDTSPKQLLIYQKALKGLRAADLLGDTKHLDKVETDLKKNDSALRDLTAQQRDNLQKLVVQSRAAMPPTGNQELASTLSKLKATSRGFGCRFGSMFGGVRFIGGNDNYEEFEDERYVVQPQVVQRPSNQQPAQPALPQWLIGTWQLMDGRMGGTTYCEFTPDGKFITIDTMLTAQGSQETARSTASARYTTAGLQLGDKVFQVTSPVAGTLTLTLNGSAVQIKRVDPTGGGGAQGGGDLPGGELPSGQGQIPNDNPRPNVIKIRGGAAGGGTQVAGQLPATMQGTWFEVSRSRLGEVTLIRYDLNADGSYDLLQYNVSAQGEVDLNAPVAQLSRVASPQQRRVSFVNGQLTLGAGQPFEEGPLAASLTRDSSGQSALSLGNSGRILTREP